MYFPLRLVLLQSANKDNCAETDMFTFWKEYWQLNRNTINNYFGDCDLFLIDAILKGYIQEGPLLDIGFGQGRNLTYFLKQGHPIIALENDQASIDFCSHFLNQMLTPNTLELVKGEVQNLPFEEDQFQTTLCVRVLHFHNTVESIVKSCGEIIRVTQPGGTIYITLSSVLHSTDFAKQVDETKVQFPDGSVRSALSENIMAAMQLDKTCEFIEPVKTIYHHGQHAESVLLLRKK